jgi:hypothetical protein
LQPDQKDLNGFTLNECSTNGTVLVGMLNDLNDVLANTLAEKSKSPSPNRPCSVGADKNGSQPISQESHMKKTTHLPLAFARKVVKFRVALSRSGR